MTRHPRSWREPGDHSFVEPSDLLHELMVLAYEHHDCAIDGWPWCLSWNFTLVAVFMQGEQIRRYSHAGNPAGHARRRR